jgi:hypothetical protein
MKQIPINYTNIKGGFWWLFDDDSSEDINTPTQSNISTSTILPTNIEIFRALQNPFTFSLHEKGFK